MDEILAGQSDLKMSLGVCDIFMFVKIFYLLFICIAILSNLFYEWNIK